MRNQAIRNHDHKLYFQVFVIRGKYPAIKNGKNARRAKDIAGQYKYYNSNYIKNNVDLDKISKKRQEKEMQEMKLDDPGSGLYNDKFNTVRCIGKGAFGFVNLAERKSDNEQVGFCVFYRTVKMLRFWATVQKKTRVLEYWSTWNASCFLRNP